MTTTLEEPRARAFRPEMADSVGSGTETPGWNLDTERRTADGKILAKALGWFSVGLGMYQLLAPRHLARTLGMEDQTAFIQAYGVRQIATGAGILAKRRPVEFVWGRLAGDALDLATLAPGLSGENSQRGNVAVAMGAVAGVALLDVLCASELSRRIVHD